MRSFEIDVFPRNGSWLIQVGSRVMSGAASRVLAERIARMAADSLGREGFTVRLTVAADGIRPACTDLLPAAQRAAA